MQKMPNIHYCGCILRGSKGVTTGACLPHSQFQIICPLWLFQAILCPTNPSSCPLDLKLAGVANMILEAESSLYYTALSAQRLRCNDKDHDITGGLESGGQDQYK